jgi:hypothetical protein
MADRGVAGLLAGANPECIALGIGARRSLADVGTGARLDATTRCGCNPSADTSLDPDLDLDAAAAHARADLSAPASQPHADPGAGGASDSGGVGDDRRHESFLDRQRLRAALDDVAADPGRLHGRCGNQRFPGLVDGDLLLFHHAH